MIELGRSAADPVAVQRGQARREQGGVVVPLHHDQAIVRHILARHEPWFSRSLPGSADSQTLALSDGVERKTDVLPDNATLRRAHFARFSRQIATQKFAERALADEADTGTVLFCVIGQT